MEKNKTVGWWEVNTVDKQSFVEKLSFEKTWRRWERIICLAMWRRRTLPVEGNNSMWNSDKAGVLVCSIISIEAWVVGATEQEKSSRKWSHGGVDGAFVICRPLQGLWLLLWERSRWRVLNREQHSLTYFKRLILTQILRIDCK